MQSVLASTSATAVGKLIAKRSWVGAPTLLYLLHSKGEIINP
jgi:hypothetical protein